MSREHVVEQGQHLASIAAQYGFTQSDVLWQHADNADLRAARRDPYVLAPGDVVRVPEPQPKQVSVATHARHRFTVRRDALTLRVRVLDLAGAPVANAPCTLSLDGADEALTTDGDGVLEKSIAPDAQRATLTLLDGARSHDLYIGWLDPPETLSGLAARLLALGYPAGDPDEPDEEQLGFAARLFCFDQAIAVSDALDATLADALVRAYGC